MIQNTIRLLARLRSAERGMLSGFMVMMQLSKSAQTAEKHITRTGSHILIKASVGSVSANLELSSQSNSLYSEKENA